MQIDITSLERLLSKADRITLVGHFNPDGDAIGNAAREILSCV